MGRISSNVGLISGLNIKDIVDQLIDIAATPRDILVDRTKGLQGQQTAIGTLSAKLISIQFEMGKLAGSSLYASKKATSSDTTSLTASISNAANAVNSTYSFTPVRTASCAAVGEPTVHKQRCNLRCPKLLVSHGGIRRQRDFAGGTQRRAGRSAGRDSHHR